MCETDYSGYPDCRNDTLQTLAKAISLGMDTPFAIETPLMWIDKAGTWEMADKLGGARAGRADRRAHAHLLYARPHAPACLGLRLRRLPRVQLARQRMGEMGAASADHLSLRHLGERAESIGVEVLDALLALQEQLAQRRGSRRVLARSTVMRSPLDDSEGSLYVYGRGRQSHAHRRLVGRVPLAAGTRRASQSCATAMSPMTMAHGGELPALPTCAPITTVEFHALMAGDHDT